MRRRSAIVLAAVPPLLLAALGTTHPSVLTPESAPWWRDLHVIGLVLFPLLALGPWAAVRGRNRVVEALVVVLGFVYAAFYTALDVLAGIGAGTTTVAVGPGPWVSALFGMADQLMTPGVHAYLAVTAIAAVTVVVTAADVPARVLGVIGGAIALSGAYSFLTSHIYPPVGVATMVVLAVGHTMLAVAATTDQSRSAERIPAGAFIDSRTADNSGDDAEVWSRLP